MFMIFCDKCGDIMRLHHQGPFRCCICGMSHGQYKEDVVEVNKNAVLININANQLAQALAHHDDGEMHNAVFTSVIVSKSTDYVKIIP